jgi:Family of unknown function (DUF6272)
MLGLEIHQLFPKNIRVARKMFGIFMEMAQNILHYSTKINEQPKEDPNGSVMIREEADHYLLAAGNVIHSSIGSKLTSKCEKINQLSQAELRKYRAELLDRPSEEGSKGAGIGLVKVALTAENPIEFALDSITPELTYFSLVVRINKN